MLNTRWRQRISQSVKTGFHNCYQDVVNGTNVCIFALFLPIKSRIKTLKIFNCVAPHVGGFMGFGIGD